MSDEETEDAPSGGPDWAWDFAYPLEQRGISRLVRAATNDKEAGTTLFVASKPTPDRAMDVVASSWLLRNFRANPVILDNHMSMRVVGQSIDERVPKDGEDAGCLIIRVKWDMESPDPSVRNVGHQHMTGVRRAGSVGFRSKKRTKRDKLPTDHPFYMEAVEVGTWWGKEKVAGTLFEQNELLEFSSASIPMHSEALQRSLGLGPAPEDERPAPDRVLVHDVRQWLEDAANQKHMAGLLMPVLRDHLRADPEFRRILRAVVESEPVPVPVPTPTAPGIFSRLAAMLEL